MPSRQYLVIFEPSGLRTVASAGTSLLDAARRAGLNLASVCNGQGICGECCVVILSGQVSELTQDELENLTEAELLQHYRLACRTRILSSVTVHVPEKSLMRQQEKIMPCEGDQWIANSSK
ncbi:MAG: 2Fe-2S iron-sulfur cluster binding domain-containing protein [Anaerolineales bacterium]|nr:2Fe-2S iron-sulfur cluster binding domain-containing protein [Anaerolineales bacterium]